MSIIFYEAETTWRSVKLICIMSRRREFKPKSSPCVSIQTHDDPFYATAIFWAGTFCEKLIYLFFRCIETQVTNLRVSKHFGHRRRQNEGVPT